MSFLELLPSNLDQYAYFGGTFLLILKKEIAKNLGFEPLTSFFTLLLLANLLYQAKNGLPGSNSNRQDAMPML